MVIRSPWGVFFCHNHAFKWECLAERTRHPSKNVASLRLLLNIQDVTSPLYGPYSASFSSWKLSATSSA